MEKLSEHCIDKVCTDQSIITRRKILNTISKYLFLFVLLASILTACGGSSTPTTAPAAQTEAPTAATEVPISLPFPSGKFIKSGTTDYGLFIGADKTFSVLQGESTIHTTFKVEGDIFTETSNEGGCETNVSFNYFFDGANLTFSYIGNPDDDKTCSWRNANFNNVTYVFTPVFLPFPTGKFVRSDRVNPVGFIFNADGTWEAKEFTYGVTQVKGTYSADDDTFTELSSDKACPPMDFNYTFDGKNLTFTYVGNPDDDKNCEGRQSSFNNVTYTLSDASESNFPTGKFIKEGTTQQGLRFNEDGTFQVFNGDIVFVNATYITDDSTFTETSNNSGCKVNVSFNYIFDGSKLTFTYVGNPEDDKTCDGRYASFNNVTYTLTEE